MVYKLSREPTSILIISIGIFQYNVYYNNLTEIFMVAHKFKSTSANTNTPLIFYVLFALALLNLSKNFQKHYILTINPIFL